MDWDGKIVSTLYVSKCNFRCPFCYNHKLILHPEKFKTISFEYIKEYLLEHKDFVDGICLTGGEPTIYDDLPKFLNKIKSLGFKIKLDTNGYDPKMVNKILKENLVDYIAMDIKAPLNEKYEKSAGVSVDLKRIKKSIRLIMDSQIEYEFRTTVVPKLLIRKDIIEIAKEIKSAEKYVLHQFQPSQALNEDLRKIKPFESNEIKDMARVAKKFVKNIKVRGLKD